MGIELAAGWLGVLMPQEIAAELEKSMDVLSTTLRDVPERQRSLRVVFDRSWQLLSDRERETFLCLSVFRGGFQREQGEAAAGTSLPILLTLVNKSFIQRENNRRFGLHEQLRFFANELLRQDKQAWQAAKQAHSHAYAAFVAGQLRKLRGREQMAALGEIERELDNIRVAWEWLVTQEDMNVLVAQMLPVLYRFYTLRARQADMEPLLYSALAKVKSAAGGKATINFLILQTVVIDLYFQQLIRMPFLYPGGRSLLQKLWPIAVAHRRDMGEWFDRFMLHHILNVGEEEAYQQWEDHIVDLRSQGDDWTLAYSLQWFAVALRVTDRNRTRPFDYLEEALPLFIKIGDKFEIAQTFFSLGWMSEWQGDYLLAVENFQQAQQLLVEQGGDARRGRIIHVMVGLYMKIGQPRKGFSLLAEEQALYRGLNRLDLLKHSLHWESIMASRHSDLEHAFRTRNESMAVGQVIARALDRDEAETLNWDYFELGELYRVAGDLVQASRYYEMAGKIFTLNDDAKGHAFYRRALGDLALTERQFDRAESHYRFYLTHARDTKSFFEIAVATIGLGRALRGLGRYQESEECLREALVLVDNPAIVDFIMWPILALAELKASKEEYMGGAILAAYVLQHPLAWLEMRSLAEGVLHEIQPQIDPNFDVQTAAQEAARTLIPDFDLAYLPPLG